VLNEEREQSTPCCLPLIFPLFPSVAPAAIPLVVDVIFLPLKTVVRACELNSGMRVGVNLWLLAAVIVEPTGAPASALRLRDR